MLHLSVSISVSSSLFFINTPTLSVRQPPLSVYVGVRVCVCVRICEHIVFCLSYLCFSLPRHLSVGQCCLIYSLYLPNVTLLSARVHLANFRQREAGAEVGWLLAARNDRTSNRKQQRRRGKYIGQRRHGATNRSRGGGLITGYSCKRKINLHAHRERERVHVCARERE